MAAVDIEDAAFDAEFAELMFRTIQAMDQRRAASRDNVVVDLCSMPKGTLDLTGDVSGDCTICCKPFAVEDESTCVDLTQELVQPLHLRCCGAICCVDCDEVLVMCPFCRAK